MRTGPENRDEVYTSYLVLLWNNCARNGMALCGKHWLLFKPCAFVVVVQRVSIGVSVCVADPRGCAGWCAGYDLTACDELISITGWAGFCGGRWF